MESVQLRIGNAYFTTTRETLLKAGEGSPLAELGHDKESKSFFDRDHTNFRHILNYLRDGDLALSPSVTLHQQVLAEAKFYKLQNLVTLLESRIQTLQNSGSTSSPRSTPRIMASSTSDDTSDTTNSSKRKSTSLSTPDIENALLPSTSTRTVSNNSTVSQAAPTGRPCGSNCPFANSAVAPQRCLCKDILTAGLKSAGLGTNSNDMASGSTLNANATANPTLGAACPLNAASGATQQNSSNNQGQTLMQSQGQTSGFMAVAVPVPVPVLIPVVAVGSSNSNNSSNSHGAKSLIDAGQSSPGVTFHFDNAGNSNHSNTNTNALNATNTVETVVSTTNTSQKDSSSNSNTSTSPAKANLAREGVKPAADNAKTQTGVNVTGLSMNGSDSKRSSETPSRKSSNASANGDDSSSMNSSFASPGSDSKTGRMERKDSSLPMLKRKRKPRVRSKPKVTDLSTEYSWEEIAKHNQRQDCWLVVKGTVYDVTEFIPEHPAGEKAILRHGGTDATEDFNFHSSSAQKMWQPYAIGKLKGYVEQRPDWSCLVM